MMPFHSEVDESTLCPTQFVAHHSLFLMRYHQLTLN